MSLVLFWNVQRENSIEYFQYLKPKYKKKVVMELYDTQNWIIVNVYIKLRMEMENISFAPDLMFEYVSSLQ